ncbi:MAG: NADH-quinone oxidoreductase subunit C [Gemmatimonadetes bacterium]|nr:NADH-quinone oxidoreductase subunit C [Gemmatimonadota bacterium]
MIEAWRGGDLAAAIEGIVAGAVEEVGEHEVWVRAGAFAEVAEGLRDRTGLDFKLLNFVTAVDYVDHFEVVYRLTSLTRGRSATVKVRCGVGRDAPEVPSVCHVWRGADLQEREVWDLMGVRFTGHPNLKRIALWEGFPGHPLRKDFLR